MTSYGRSVLPESTGRPIMVTADGRPDWKAGGITVDWSLVTAVSGAAVTLADETVVQIGDKYLRYGQVMVAVGVAEVQTVTFTGGPTAGSAVITLPADGADAAQTAAAIAYNATAQVFQDTLNALSRLGPLGTSVARTGAGTAGDPYVYTITFARSLGAIPQLTSTHTFTGGTTPTTTHATTTAGSGTGLYGPYDSGASDGRQTLTRGLCFILNQTVLYSELGSSHPAVFDGGLVFKERLVLSPYTALAPSITNFEAAFPRISYAQ